jgi:hypothetical protein
LQEELIEYQKAVCAKDGQSAFVTNGDGRRMSIAAPILKDLPEEDEDDDKMETGADEEQEQRDASKVSRNLLRPTHVYEESPLL